jgi:cellulose synthase/poly-beta-1,6-N-acetylglucosamine synthase-like glycosyltransferase
VATGPKEKTIRAGSGDWKPVPPVRHALPTIPTSAQLLEAVQRMTPSEAQQAMRHRVVPISWEPGRITFVAAGERAKAYAAEQGLTVSAISTERTLLRELQAGQEGELTSHALWGLKNRFPHYSVAQPFAAKEALWLVLGLALIAFGVMWDRPTGEVTAFAAMLALFALATGVKIWCLLPAKLPQIPLAMKIADNELPIYSVLVPLLREAKVADQMVRAIGVLAYPQARLDIKFIIEAEDHAALKFFDELRLPSHMEVIIVPKSEPQTRHKALNYALPFARGELIAVYDADSIPAPDQLRRIAGTFAVAPKTVACLQTQLGFFNRNENWLTRQCAVEYAYWFKLMFPKLAKFGSPLLFAGTSTHYRTQLLRQAGGFDAHNVARDSGLGVRLARLGFRTALVPSLTREEAPCRLRDWLAQRVRWIKGALQTAIVNTRSPVKMWRELGTRKFFLTQALTAGAIIVSLLHPFFLAWIASTAVLLMLDMPAASQLWLFLLALYGLVASFAYMVAMAATIRASLFLGRGGISWATTILTAPAYWLMISAATWLAILQYFTAARHWAKTPHGVSRVKPQAGPEKKPKEQ